MAKTRQPYHWDDDQLYRLLHDIERDPPPLDLSGPKWQVDTDEMKYQKRQEYLREYDSKWDWQWWLVMVAIGVVTYLSWQVYQ